VALRFGNVYGPRPATKSSVVAAFFRRAIEGKNLVVYGDGAQMRDFIYVEDICEAIYLGVTALGLSALDCEKEGGKSPITPGVAGAVFQIATFTETTVNAIAAKVKELVELECAIQVEQTHEAKRAGDVERNFSDITKAREL